jgi:putative lipoic acid-binding regulatory protein
MDREAAKKLLEDHHSFPSDHTFRVIVRAEGPDADEVMADIARFCGLPDLHGRVTQAPSTGGKWVSLRIELPCESGDTVLDIYAHLSTLPKIARYL